MASVRLKSYDGEVHDLPDVCMKCGAPSAVRKNKTFSWCPGFTPKRCEVEVPLCERHKNHWLMRKLLVLLLAFLDLLLGVFALGVGFVILVAGDSGRNDALFVMLHAGCVVLLIGCLILLVVVQATTIRTNEITDTYIRLVSVSEEFAAACKEELPDVRGLLDRAARERWNDGERRADKKDEKTPPPGPATWDIKTQEDQGRD